MNWKKIVCTALAVPILYAGASLLKPSVSDASVPREPVSSKLELALVKDPDSFTIPLPEEYFVLKDKGFDCKVQETGEQLLQLNCEKKPQRRASFFFDDSRITIGSLKGGDSSAMDKFIGADGRIGAKALLGYESFVFGFGVEQQTLFQNLKVGDGWDAGIIGIGFHLNLDFRYYFGERRNMFVGVGNDHLSERFIDEVAIQQFLADHPEIKIDSPVVDVVSYQFGGKFSIGESTNIEGRLGYNAYQTTPLHTFSALWDKSKRKSEKYPYDGFFELKVPHKFSEHWGIYGQVQSEFNSREMPTNFITGIEKDFKPYPYGLRFLFGWNVGRDKNTLQKTRFGIERNGTLRMIELYANF